MHARKQIQGTIIQENYEGDYTNNGYTAKTNTIIVTKGLPKK